jgi:mono/diheme cytochrome c family protein
MADHRILRPVLLVTALVAGSMALKSAPTWPPQQLRDTGLYADWTAKAVAPENLPFSPQYPLWTDGAAKARWIHLPAGTWIDASDPDAWRFPVGTRLWKEFRFERRAETRLIEHTSGGWQYATYVWNEEETEATLAPERGILRSVPIKEGVRHAIPSRLDCRACHEGSPVRVLGFSALQLSPDRDPNAPHAETPPTGAVDLRWLIERGLVRGLPTDLVDVAPRIAARTPTARAALGYLHGNCSSCHTAGGELATLEFSLQYVVGTSRGETPPAVSTGVGRASLFKMPGWSRPGLRLVAGKADESVLLARMSSRHPVAQMPPLGTQLVDADAVELMRRWIDEELRVSGPGDQRVGDVR